MLSDLMLFCTYNFLQSGKKTALSPRRSMHLLILFIFWLSSFNCALVTSEHVDWISFGGNYLEDPQPLTPKVKSVPEARLAYIQLISANLK